ncbi:MAG: hypothetical protein ACI9XZ_002786, partial [Alphaproteobacteria bacterium]
QGRSGHFILAIAGVEITFSNQACVSLASLPFSVGLNVTIEVCCLIYGLECVTD